MSRIGDHLKSIREQKQLSTVEAQSRSEGRISQSYVVQVEKGERTPSVAKLEAFADAYDVDIHNLIDVMLEKRKGKKPEPLFTPSDQEIRLIKQIRKLPEKKRKSFFILVLG